MRSIPKCEGGEGKALGDISKINSSTTLSIKKIYIYLEFFTDIILTFLETSALHSKELSLPRVRVLPVGEVKFGVNETTL